MRLVVFCTTWCHNMLGVYEYKQVLVEDDMPRRMIPVLWTVDGGVCKVHSEDLVPAHVLGVQYCTYVADIQLHLLDSVHCMSTEHQHEINHRKTLLFSIFHLLVGIPTELS